jgi:isopentenyl diphosphate isomerase/L-lactate dehydrogenase-like FMN-dependent dehydrogenase
MPEAPHLTELSGEYQCLHEFIPAARAKLTSDIWGYLVGATESETTLRRNRAALDSIALRPRVLRDVSQVDAGTTFLGMKLRLPVMLAPSARWNHSTPAVLPPPAVAPPSSVCRSSSAR